MSIWDYRKNFAYDEPLEPTDPRRVNLNEARGDYSRKRLYRDLGVKIDSENNAGVLKERPGGKFVLFGGHRGCGKSTELREIARWLKAPDRFFVVELDVLRSLDINNLNYADIALALAEALAERAGDAGIDVPPVFIQPLQDWFKQISRHTALEEGASAELKVGASTGTGLPLVGRLFASLTMAIRSNTTYRTEIRENVRNTFSDFARAFNQLVAYIQGVADEKGLGRNIIFVVDGTDRLRSDEADAFFVRDIHQFRQLRANCILCAPISVLNEQGQIAQTYDSTFRLPMVKLAEKRSPQQKIEIAWERLRQFVTNRLPAENFDSADTLDFLIGYSGGHPRDLLRLVNLCFQEIDEGPITRKVAETAAQRLSNEYKRLIQPDDYPLLAKIDSEDASFAPSTEQTRRLLYDLVLLEYNSYWWQSHPAVRALDAYGKSVLT